MTRRDRRVDRFRTVERRIFDRHLPGAREHHIAWSGGSIRAIEAGSGPPVAFLHGITGTLTNFASIAVLGEPAYAFAGARAKFPLNILGLPVLGPLTLAAPPPPLPVYRRTIRRGFGDHALANIDPDVLDANRLSVWTAGGARSVAGLMRALMGWRGEAADDVPLSDDDLDRIDVPIWFLWGDQDPFMSPEAGATFIDRFDHATLDVVPGGHVPWLDVPDTAYTRLRTLIDST